VCKARVLFVALAACSAGGAPYIVPSTIDVGTTPPLLIEGLSATDYLNTGDEDLDLVDDYQAVIGGQATRVSSVDAAGVTVVLSAPLAVGSYPLDLRARAHTWHVPDALAVVAGVPPGDAGTGPRNCPAAPMGCTAFTCPSTSSCYYSCMNATFTGSTSQCVTKSIGCLVTIDDQAENDCVAAATGVGIFRSVWIGYQQAPGSMEPAGGWGWACPDGSNFVNWAPFEPNNLLGQDCGAMTGFGKWGDFACTTKMPFVCELP
jgi:hypothetical protein